MPLFPVRFLFFAISLWHMSKNIMLLIKIGQLLTNKGTHHKKRYTIIDYLKYVWQQWSTMLGGSCGGDAIFKCAKKHTMKTSYLNISTWLKAYEMQCYIAHVKYSSNIITYVDVYQLQSLLLMLHMPMQWAAILYECGSNYFFSIVGCIFIS